MLASFSTESIQLMLVTLPGNKLTRSQNKQKVILHNSWHVFSQLYGIMAAFLDPASLATKPLLLELREVGKATPVWSILPLRFKDEGRNIVPE